MTDSYRSIVRRIHEEAESQGELAGIDAWYAPDFCDPRHPERGSGPEGVKQHIERLRRAFPDLQVTIDGMIAEGDRVVVRVTTHGTHKGAFAGIEPTGARIEWSGIVIRRMAGGQVLEQWAQYDTAGLVEQLRTAAASGA